MQFLHFPHLLPELLISDKKKTGLIHLLMSCMRWSNEEGWKKKTLGILILNESKNISDKLRKMNIQVKLTLLVVETQVRVATGQKQHKQIPGKFYSEFIYLIILNTKIKHKRVMRETCITPLKQLRVCK